MNNHFSITGARPRTMTRQRGAVAIVVGLSIAVLIGFAGLALDLGRLYVAKTELQNSSDACALAAARELTGTSSNQLTIAEAAGMTTGRANFVMFQHEAVTYAENSSVTFSQTLNGTYLTKDMYGAAEALAMKYARCTVSRSRIATWFMQVMNILPGIANGEQSVSATAVGSVAPAQTNCALPVAVCGADIAGKPPGTWLESVLGPPGGELTGNFKWVDFTPPAGGASELGGILKSTGVCNLPSVGAEVGQPGAVTSLADEWNSRFGIYKGSTRPTEAVPDFTGYAYTDAATSWPSKFNAYSDFRTRRSSYAEYQGDSLTGLNVQGTVQASGYLAAHGADRRLAVVPVVDCPSFVSGSTAPVQSFACILMLHPLNNSGGGSGTGAARMYLEYLGASNAPGSPCATLGAPGGASSAGPLVPVLVQ